MSLAHGRSTVVVRAQIAAMVVNPLPATVGMAVISPYEDQGETRNAAEVRSRSFLLEGRQGRLCPAQSRNFTMYDGSETVRTKDRVTLGAKPEPPRPLARELPPADLFPIDALGPLLRDAVQAIHDKLQAPLAIGGQSVLGTATLAVQGHADVQLPTGQTRPVSSFLITIAESGERKSGCDAEALWPIRHREKILREQHDQDLSDYQNEKGAWECARDNATKGVKGDRAAIKLALDKLGPMPTAPLEPILTCTEPTFEGLCKLFAVGHPSLGIFTTEGGHFIGGHGMSDDNKLRTATGLSSVWDGDPIRRVRAGDGPYVLPGRRLAVHLMVQPDVAGILLNDRLLTNQDLLSRFLVTAPDSAAGTRLWREPAPTSDAALKRYGARLLEIMEARSVTSCFTVIAFPLF